ncbi:Hsp70 family protein [Pseudonocardia thermophila]|uniref:Hsp70 family protein n=1 Tax=Pseudonocardia thermophila TaxID=1848 RepID=UPI00248D529A|nr:Hsp70 family protein [Pseudonocardia thermophila]
MDYVIGIDVGTTRTSAAIAHVGNGPGDIEVVALGDRASSVPSVLYLGDDGAIVVGEAAERRAVTDPDHVVREFKRRIGDPTPLVVGGRPWAPEDLSARLTRWVVDRVAQREGGPASRIAVTHPASWGSHKIDLMGKALAAQGLQVMFLAEPQAAALHYAATERVEPGSTIAVYDLGGGTFDAAVVHKDANGAFTLLGRPEGLERLGGVDFDDVIFDHVREALPDAFAGLDEDDPAVLSAVAAVRRECREAKEALSADTEVSIQVLMPSARGTVRLHRSEFEAMIRPQIEETVSALRRAITSAGRTPEQLTAVLLVGGSSRIPLVAELVSQQLGRPVAVDADPKNAISKGAALALTPNASATGGHVPRPQPNRGPLGPVPAGGMAASTATGTWAGPAGTGPLAGLPPPRPTTPPPPFPERPALGAPEGGFPARTGGYGAPAGNGTGPGHAYAPGFRDDYGYGDDHDYADYAQDRGDRPARYSSPALLVSAGGAAAALAVIGAAFLLPHTPTTASPAGRIVADVPTTSAAPTTTAEPEPEARPSPRPRPVVRPTTSAPPATTSAAPTSQPTQPTSGPATSPTQPPSSPANTSPAEQQGNAVGGNLNNPENQGGGTP